MGIVSRDNVHNVNITARVRRACIHSYIHIWALYLVTMYTMLRLLRGSDAHVTFLYPYMSIGSRDNVHNVRVTARVIYSTCIRQKISYPYMGTV